MKNKVHIDFETRSEVNLTTIGSWNYSKHPSTHVICLAWRVNDGPKKIWYPPIKDIGVSPDMWEHDQLPHPKLAPIEELLTEVENGCIMAAHNATFETEIWAHVCVEKYGWPPVDDDNWECTLAQASVFALPKSLKDVSIALGLKTQKDMAGNRCMLKLSKPRKPLKQEREAFKKQGLKPSEFPVLWYEGEEDFMSTYNYCLDDVQVEWEIDKHLFSLTQSQREAWKMVQKINKKGLPVDLEMCRKALDVAKKEKEILSEEYKSLTDGSHSPSQRAKVKDYLNEFGTRINGKPINIPNTNADTTKLLLSEEYGLTPETHRVVEILLEFNKTSTRKYKAMIDRADPDGRVRDVLQYHTASTGRLGGRGIQPQNFPRGSFKPWHMEAGCDLILEEDLEMMRIMSGNVMEHLTSCLRGAICAPEGKELLVSDYSAIEARVIFWEAGEHEAIDYILSGGDIYNDMASTIFGVTIDRKDPDQFLEGFLGKQCVLAGSYGMGVVRFINECKRYGQVIDHAMGKKVIDTYRKVKFPKIPKLWRDQEAAAIKAVKFKGQVIKSGKFAWRSGNEFLQCMLPSGRKISYYKPEIRQEMTQWGDPKATLTYMTNDSFTRKWTRITTWGGNLVQNQTQAVAGDIMIQAMINGMKHPHISPLISVHDELISESDIGKVSIEEYNSVLCDMPSWAEGIPLNAEGYKTKRYMKA